MWLKIRPQMQTMKTELIISSKNLEVDPFCLTLEAHAVPKEEAASSKA